MHKNTLQLLQMDPRLFLNSALLPFKMHQVCSSSSLKTSFNSRAPC